MNSERVNRSNLTLDIPTGRMFAKWSNDGIHFMAVYNGQAVMNSSWDVYASRDDFDIDAIGNHSSLPTGIEYALATELHKGVPLLTLMVEGEK